MKFFIHLLIVMAIVSAGVSPACAFMGNKKGWIEICAADGSVKKIQVSEDFLPDVPEVPNSSHEQTFLMDDCSFCFMSSNVKAVGAENILALKSLSSSYIKVGGGLFIPASQDLKAFSARAPPVFS